jgi:hypothetical protein
MSLWHVANYKKGSKVAGSQSEGPLLVISLSTVYCLLFLRESDSPSRNDNDNENCL